MNYTEIIVDKKGPAVWVTLNKPHRKNALGKQTFLELSALLDDIEKDPTVVAVVFKGAGDSFCSGIDLKDAAGSKDPAERLAFNLLSKRIFARIEHLSKIVIAVIHGYTMAGGLELAMLCDVIIADENVKVGDGHIRTGIIPNGGGSQRLPRLIGTRKAKELLYTGELMSGKEAEQIGLVNKAVPADKLQETTEAFIAKLADKPPLALAALKLVVNRGMESSLASALEFEGQVVKGLEASEDFKESMAAFVEKRKPVYKGR
jgi:enoyl-CoA hydratase/3-hydroxyacyl-CoA dehydrogenase